MQNLLAFLMVGLLGSPHCVGMCGGFVAAYSMRGRGVAFLSHAAFALGRITSYVLMGVAAGALGWGMKRGAQGMGIQGAYSWLFGVLMIAVGLAQLGLLPLDRLLAPLLRRMEGRMIGVVQRASRGGDLVPVLLMGLMVGFLPCHLSYGAAAMAAATGGALSGALGMLLFGLGTTPLLLAFGFASRGLGALVRSRVVTVSGLILIIMGVWTIYRAWPTAAAPCCHHTAQMEGR